MEILESTLIQAKKSLGRNLTDGERRQAFIFSSVHIGEFTRIGRFSRAEIDMKDSTTMEKEKAGVFDIVIFILSSKCKYDWYREISLGKWRPIYWILVDWKHAWTREVFMV